MTRNAYKFDNTKPYGTVRAIKNGKGVKYQQDGRFFSHAGEYVCDADGCNPEAAKAPAIPSAEKLSASDKRKKALAEAADRLGDFTVPSDMQDAARENAEALAAEGSA